MINAMIDGTLVKDAELKKSASGNEYLALVIKVSTNDGHLFARVSLFGDDVQYCMSLAKGDAVSVVGSLSISVWETGGKPAPSLAMMANRAQSPAVKKPRQSRPPAAKQAPTQRQFRAAAEAQAIRKPGELTDDIPWDE